MRALDRFANPVPLSATAALGPRAFQATLAACGADPEPLALGLSGTPGAAACAELGACFAALRAGPATVAVTHAGAHIRGSPWQVLSCVGRTCTPHFQGPQITVMLSPGSAAAAHGKVLHTLITHSERRVTRVLK